MALSRRRADRGGLDAWPGYVDALSTLLMVIIFVLLVFVLSQGFLGAALSSRDEALETLNRRVAELSELLNLERGQMTELRGSLGRTQQELRDAAASRDRLALELRAAETARAQLTSERDSSRAERDQARARIAGLDLAAREATQRLASLETRLTDANTRTERSAEDAARTVARLTETSRALENERASRTLAETRAAAVVLQLAEAERQLAAMRAELAELNRTVRADRATIEMRLADLARLSEQLRALTALRERMEAELRQQGAARQTAEASAQDATRLGEQARAQVALLSRQIDELRAQLSRITAALELREVAGRDQDVQIANLGQRLNAALAAQVETLQLYRSDFFGRLREVLGTRQDIRVVGDRFVFQSEVLFPPGSADLSEAGQAQIRRVGGVLREISRQIPPDVNWVLRVDGHADRTPISNQRFASNWELSAARSIAVSRLLVQEGLPANRVAATAFGDNQPLDSGEAPDSYARNRRIEFRLTDR